MVARDLKTKAEEHEEAGRRLPDTAGELESTTKGVLEQTRSTASLIAGELRDDFGRNGESGVKLGRQKEQSLQKSEGDDLDRWLAFHKDEVRRMVCAHPDHEKATFCQTH